MPNFIHDNTDLPFPKVAELGSRERHLSDEDWNTTNQALVDVRDYVQAMPGSTVIYNPFLAASGSNAYTDWEALMDAMSLTQGYKVLQFDNTRSGTAAGITIPTSLPTQNLYDPTGPFTANMVGRQIMIDGDTTVGNNGSFTVTSVPDAFNIRYSNSQSGAAATAFAGQWVVQGLQYITTNTAGGSFSVTSSVVTFTPTTPGLFTSAMDYASITIAGATSSANNGTFTIRYVDANTVTWVNTAGVTEALTGPGGTFEVYLMGCRIPAGGWDMRFAEWASYFPPYTRLTDQAVRVDIVDGCWFENLRKIGTELVIYNHNMVPSRAPVLVRQPLVFELGTGLAGDFPTINNPGTQAFFDCSNLTTGQLFTLRVVGYILGPNPAIEMGAGTGSCNTQLMGLAKLGQNAIRGTAASVLNISYRHGLVEINQQSNIITAQSGVIGASGFAGNINYGLQNTTNMDRRIWSNQPASATQAIPVAKTTAFAASTGLGHNMAGEITSAGAIDQPLPRIRDFSITGGSQTQGNPGALNATGMEVNFRQHGAGSINVWGDSPITAQAAAVNTAGGTFAFASNTVTFTPTTAGLFTSAMTGRAITISGATSPANDGTFIVTYVDANSVSWTNASGVAEAFSGNWRLGDTINKLMTAVVVKSGCARTFVTDGVSNWKTIAMDLGAPSSAYTPTNVTPDRAYDANSTTTDELADVLGTLIADLQAKGILG